MKIECTKILLSHQGSVLVTKYNCILIHTFTGHGYEVVDLVSTRDNLNIYSVADKQIYQWDVSKGEIVRRFNSTTHTQRITSVAINGDGTLLFTGGADRLVKVWDLRSKNDQPIQVLDDAEDTITGLYISETRGTVKQGHVHGDSCGHGHKCDTQGLIEKQIITSSVDGCIRIYDAKEGTLAIDQEEYPISSMTLTRDKRCFLVSSTDSKIRLIDRDSCEILKEYTGHHNKTYKINTCTNFDDSMILSGSEDNCLYIWDYLNASILNQLPGHTDTITSVHSHPSKNQFITSSKDGSIRVWSNPESNQQ
ncbi:WD40 repeat-containing protein [Tieghemostelium lacteum]|uniref:WD40 repeat-containing protein n=1 Tax=Tieghemostelium lacteum TaxID=361077 RepID=A0A151Z434_TIELA|nr:WD40 repeat-containing protein [Tieghemostelium lacteum]|eukprot:KYQ88733.1 WD40 repeat-containing protein [Tieghemostelium lacteum]